MSEIYPVRTMSLFFATFSRSSLFFHPIPPASTSFCGIFADFFNSKKASIRMFRFFRGSIVPRYSRYGGGIIGEIDFVRGGSIPSWITAMLFFVLYRRRMSVFVFSEGVTIRSAVLKMWGSASL